MTPQALNASDGQQARLRVVDLYAGAGGLSVGVRAAGGAVVLAVEADGRAARTYEANHRGVVVLQEEITDGWDVRIRLKEHLDEPSCDLIVGGPPCKGWSTLGQRGSQDRRERMNRQVDYFLDQVALVTPPAVVMENVRGLAVRDGGAHLRHAVARLRRMGYHCEVHDVRAMEHGVPQLRHRIFVVAWRTSLRIKYELPRPIAQPEWTTVWDAIGDLPSLAAGEAAKRYSTSPTTSLQRRLRGACVNLTWHEAPAHSEKIMQVLRALRGEGASRRVVEPTVKLNSGFHNTYCRLRSDEPAPAVTSSVGRVSSGRNAHPFDDRALTPREAARLQTFPDSYRWVGERWPVYEMIGNAVPPLLAERVMSPLVDALSSALYG
jgi:DNA (cytosine-5)-methyltransferase 1